MFSIRKVALMTIVTAGICSPYFVFAESVSISALPSSSVTQGEPIMIQVNNLSVTASVKSVVFDNNNLGVFSYQSKPTAFVGIDLNKKPGTYQLVATLSDGKIIQQDITILERPKVVAPLGIPAKLGGNTPASQKNLVSSLANENLILNKIKTDSKSLWTSKFIFPLASPVVTDAYGYLRQTGPYSIAHKGTDFRAEEGTSVVAMNRGIVRTAKLFPTYGNTIVIDHGQGLMTFYMHLSKIKVKVGQLVQQGQVIGLSGQTGYAAEPHLHLTVRINNISIDPMKFMILLN